MVSRKTNPDRRSGTAIDRYADWLKHVKNASRTRIVLVEHKKDKDVLESLGVKNVEYFKSSPEYALIEKIAESQKECILLFDADRPSNKQCERIKSELEQHGVKVSTRFRKILFTGKAKEIGGFLKFLHERVADTPRKHEGQKY